MPRIFALGAFALGTLVRPTLALLVCAAIPFAAAAADSSPHCDRGCLVSVLDRYLQAVIEHDPAAAPLSDAYRETENAINVPRGEGVWRSVTALGPVQRRYADPVSEQVAYFGIVHEGGALAIVTFRLRVETGAGDARTAGAQGPAVTEAEWYVARNGDPGLPGAKPPNVWNPPGLIAHPPPQRTLPQNERVPRRTLIAIVNSYYDAIVSHDGRVAHARRGCNRYENGTRVTGRRGGRNDDCVSGFEHFNLANVVARRVPLVDEEAGMVLGLGVFIRRPGSPVPRNAFSEWFEIGSDGIRDIWTAMYYPGPQRPVPNWPPYDGNFPLPAGTIPATPGNK
ncbi:MAG: hypothetical protein ACREUG_01305 [Steroidobacteraceae bacterium]